MLDELLTDAPAACAVTNGQRGDSGNRSSRVQHLRPVHGDQPDDETRVGRDEHWIVATLRKLAEANA